MSLWCEEWRYFILLTINHYGRTVNKPGRCVSPCGNKIACSGYDGQISIYDIKDGTNKKTIETPGHILLFLRTEKHHIDNCKVETMLPLQET